MSPPALPVPLDEHGVTWNGTRTIPGSCDTAFHSGILLWNSGPTEAEGSPRSGRMEILVPNEEQGLLPQGILPVPVPSLLPQQEHLEKHP